MEEKDYIVSLSVSFITPLGAKDKSEAGAIFKARKEFGKKFDKFKKELNDIADIEIDLDYIEED